MCRSCHGFRTSSLSWATDPIYSADSDCGGRARWGRLGTWRPIRSNQQGSFAPLFARPGAPQRSNPPRVTKAIRSPFGASESAAVNRDMDTLPSSFSIQAAEEPAPATEAVTDAAANLASTDWWFQDALPSAVRIAFIIAAALVLRWVLLALLKRAVARRAASVVDVPEDSGRALIVAERKAQRAKTLGALFRNIVTIIVMTLMVLLILGELGFDLAPLIAGAGIVGVALGFGAQSLVADFLSGIFILMEDQYGVGDVVDVGDATGTVEEVQLRTTQLRSVDGSLWFVRNGEIMRVGNMSQDWSRSVLDIGVAYATDVPKAKAAMTKVGEEFATDPEYSDSVLEVPEVWGVEDLAADSVVLRMVVKTHPGTQWTAARVLRERIKAAFDEQGIEIPFQQRTVWLRTDPADEQSAATTASSAAEQAIDLTTSSDRAQQEQQA